MTWIIIIGIAALVVVLCAVVKKFGKRAPDPTREEIKKLIGDFLAGGGGPYDWDDFVTYPLRNPESEKIRKECFDIYHDYPSSKKTEWCSEEGMKKLKDLYSRLSKTA